MCDADGNAEAGKNLNLLDFIPGNVAVTLTLTCGVNGPLDPGPRTERRTHTSRATLKRKKLISSDFWWSSIERTALRVASCTAPISSVAAHENKWINFCVLYALRPSLNAPRFGALADFFILVRATPPPDLHAHCKVMLTKMEKRTRVSFVSCPDHEENFTP